jgi:hypothetical protein
MMFLNKSLLACLIMLMISAGVGPTLLAQVNDPGKDKNYEKLYSSLSKKVDKERIRKGVFYLSKDPLPRRVLNWSRPGQKLSSLEEADAWIMQKLTDKGYAPKTDETKVQAFGRDRSKPISQQYALPSKDAPWYTARNIIAEKKGKDHPDDLIIILAHKDSQSWIESPGANDNAIGTCGALELALVLSAYQPSHTIRFIFCNEEHFPWTSVTAAKDIKSAGLNALVVINLDGIGVKSPQDAGKLKNITRYSTPEGEKIADLIASLNKRHTIGLEQSKSYAERPGDDDGSFIKAGFPWTVLNTGSIPYADPNYHTEGDVAEKVDVANAERTVQLTLAAILHLDIFGRP